MGTACGASYAISAALGLFVFDTGRIPDRRVQNERLVANMLFPPIFYFTPMFFAKDVKEEEYKWRYALGTILFCVGLTRKVMLESGRGTYGHAGLYRPKR